MQEAFTEQFWEQHTQQHRSRERMNAMQVQLGLCCSPRSPEARCPKCARGPGLCTPHQAAAGCNPGAFATLGKAAPSLEDNS